MQQTIVCAISYLETCSLRGSQTRTHERFAGLRHAYASLSLLLHRVVKSPPNISSRSCHCALWAVLRSQGQVASWWKILGKKLEM